MKAAVAALALLGSLAAHSAPKPSIITGTLSTAEDCAKDLAHAWLSEGSTLLYHADIPVNGTFEFHTIPGKFNLVITSSGGCFIEKVVEVKAGQATDLALALVPPKRMPASGGKK